MHRLYTHVPSWLAAATVLTFWATSPLGAQSAQTQPARADETQHTAAALIAVADHWSDAEASGDTTYLEQLLAPEYRSVNVDGSVYDRSRIIAGAAKQGSPAAIAALAAWRKEHHHGKKVVIDHDTAVLSYYPSDHGSERALTSSDVFLYHDHHWQALYSAHTTLKS